MVKVFSKQDWKSQNIILYFGNTLHCWVDLLNNTRNEKESTLAKSSLQLHTCTHTHFKLAFYFHSKVKIFKIKPPAQKNNLKCKSLLFHNIEANHLEERRLMEKGSKMEASFSSSYSSKYPQAFLTIKMKNKIASLAQQPCSENEGKDKYIKIHKHHQRTIKHGHNKHPVMQVGMREL